MKKLLLMVLLTTILAAAFTSPGSGQEINLQFAIKETDHGPVVEAFKERFPDINVDIVSFSGDYDQMLMQYVSGVAADIQFLEWYEHVDRFIDAGLFLNLNPFIERDNVDDMIGEIPEVVRDRFSRQGKLFGIPEYLHMRAVGINRDYREAKGLPLPDSNWTWDDFREYAMKLTQRESDDTIKVYGTTVNPHWAHVQGWLGGTAAQLHEPGNRSIIALNNPEAIQCLEYLQDLVQRQGPYGGMAWGILGGNVAMQANMASNYAKIMHESLRDYDIAETPLGPAGTRAIVVNDSSFFINKSTRYPDAAWEFIKFFLSREGQCIYIQTTGFQPARVGLVEDWKQIVQTLYPSISDEWFDPFMNAYAYAQVTEYFTDSQVITEYIHPAMQKIINEGASARSTLESMVPAANAFIAGRKK